ncbi:MAG: AMIN domain-containing protein [Desulfurivibrio sp.]|nr:AMIN domain-containing protein [Desulfurivibrio sp.]
MKRFPCFIMALLLVVTVTAGGRQPARAEAAAEAGADYRVEGVELQSHDGQWRLRISGNETPVYTTYQLFEPPRLMVDIVAAELPDGAALADLARGPVRKARSRKIGENPAVLQLELVLDGDFSYTSQLRGHDILLSHDPGPARRRLTVRHRRRPTFDEPIQPVIPALATHKAAAASR